jgi:hypothetical protein
LLAAMKQPMYSGAPIQIKMMSKRSQKQRGRSRSESMPLPGPSCNSVTPPQTPLPAPLSMDDDIQQICGVQQPSFSTNIFANSTASEMAAVNFQDPFSYQRLAPPSPLGWPHSQQQQSNDLAAITNANDMNISRSQQLTMLQSSDNPSSTLFNYYQPPRPRRHTTSSPSSNSGFMATEGADLWHQSFNQFTSYRVPDYDPLLSDGVNCAANDFYNPTVFCFIHALTNRKTLIRMTIYYSRSRMSPLVIWTSIYSSSSRSQVLIIGVAHSLIPPLSVDTDILQPRLSLHTQDYPRSMMAYSVTTVYLITSSRWMDRLLLVAAIISLSNSLAIMSLNLSNILFCIFPNQ